jgi:hypothetical protein
LSAPLAEVTTHWDGGGWFSADPVSDHLGCEWELGPRFEPVADLEPYFVGWEHHIEELTERLTA